MERYLESEGLPFTVFQPLYIYGPHTAKDCEQYFIDRIIRCEQQQHPQQAAVRSRSRGSKQQEHSAGLAAGDWPR